jgi:hypothetical protein
MIQQEQHPAILILNDVEETRREIERLLLSDGYRVSTAADEWEAALKARVQAPDLIIIRLVSAPFNLWRWPGVYAKALAWAKKFPWRYSPSPPSKKAPKCTLGTTST